MAVLEEYVSRGGSARLCEKRLRDVEVRLSRIRADGGFLNSAVIS
jgi:hypothetical protein